MPDIINSTNNKLNYNPEYVKVELKETGVNLFLVGAISGMGLFAIGMVGIIVGGVIFNPILMAAGAGATVAGLTVFVSSMLFLFIKSKYEVVDTQPVTRNFTVIPNSL